MKQLKDKISKSGLKLNFIAEKVGIKNPSHLTMMLNGYANMPTDVERKINDLLIKATV